jgi:hypothetical protein
VEFCAGDGGQMTKTEIKQIAEELDSLKVQ